MTTILDCTLRDGGYYTNWDFPKDIVENYIKTMSELPYINYIEIGYRSPEKMGYFGEYFYLPIQTIKKIRKQLSDSKKISIMINTKDCSSVDELEFLLDECRDDIDLIRFAVAPTNFNHALKLANKSKELGFEVALNIMYISEINAFDLKNMIVNILQEVPQIDFVYLVDSYGSCFPEEVFDKIKVCIENSNIKIGYHGHDNIQLAFANSLKSIEAGADMIDATITGMGRGAGNLMTELLFSYLTSDRTDIDNYNLANLVEKFNEIKYKYGWGTSLPYMISGIQKLPQGEIMNLVSMKRYNTNTILNILKKKNRSVNIPPIKYFNLGNLNIGTENIILVGGGNEVKNHREGLKDFAKKSKSIFIHASLKNSKRFLDKDIINIVCLPGDEINFIEKYYDDRIIYIISEKQQNTKLIEVLNYDNCFVLGETEIDKIYDGKVNNFDPPLLMSLKVAKLLKGKKLFLSGFDGYETDNATTILLREENQQIIDLYNQYSKSGLVSVTPTKYDITEKSLYSLIVWGIEN